MPYTWGLLGSIADVAGDPDKPLVPIPGTPPSLLNPPSGCSFHPRCAHTDKVEGDRCVTELPELRPGAQPGHLPAVPPRATPTRSTRPRSKRRCSGDRAAVHDQRRRASRSRRGPPLLEVTDLVKYFPVKSSGVIRRTIGQVQAVDGVSLHRRQGQSLGLVGESGCGKTTTGRVDHPAATSRPSGTMKFEGHEIGHTQPQGDAAVPARDPADLPGPVLVAQPAAHGRHDRRRARW